MTKAEKRNILVDVLLAALIAIAYQEMVTVVRASFHPAGLTWDTAALAIIFSLTTLRFLIGNQMYLVNPKVQDACGSFAGYLWFFDLSVILLQTVIMVFLGGLAATSENPPLASAPIGSGCHPHFFNLLGLLLLIDMGWILTHWLRKRCLQDCHDFPLHWGWFFLNGGMLLCLLGAYFCWGEPGLYLQPGLNLLLVASAIAFIVDVILLDYYGVIRDKLPSEKLAAVDDKAKGRV